MVSAVLKKAIVATVSEFMATSLLVLLGCMGCGSIGGHTPSHVEIVLGFGTVVAVNVQIFGHLSGAHMNPCLTVAAWIMKCITPPMALAYIVAQCLGAIAGFGVALLFTNSPSGLCVTKPAPELAIIQVVGIEALGTAVLTWIFCALAFDPAYKGTRDGVAIKFGVCIVAIALIIGPYTGGSVNPARSLAPALWSGEWGFQWVYWVGPYAGAIFSAYLYRYLLCSTAIEKEEVRIEMVEQIPLSRKNNDHA